MSDSGAPRFWPFSLIEPSDFKMPERKFTRIEVHAADSSEALKCAFVEELNAQFMLDGWYGIGYHFVIDTAGNICTGRPLEERAVLRGCDIAADVIAIGQCLTTAAQDSAEKLCEAIVEKYQLARRKIEVAHV